MLQLSARTLVHGTGFHGPVLATDTPLSLWGGLDLEGTVCDQHHPLQGQSVTDTVWILPGGRGSCTASQVLLEVIRNGVAPSAIVLRDADALLCVGALVAWQVLEIKDIPTIVVLDDGFEYLLKYTKENPSAHAVLSGGQVHCYPNRTSVVEMGACDGEQRDELHLTERESHLMNQASSEAEKQSLYVLFHYARITQAQEYLPVTSAHIVSTQRTSRIFFLQALVGRMHIHWTRWLGICPTAGGERRSSQDPHHSEFHIHRSSSNPGHVQ